MRNVTEIQQRLIKLGYLPKTYVEGGIEKPSDDGTFGKKSLAAYNNYRKIVLHKPNDVIPPVHLDALNADLFPGEQPTPVLTSYIFDEIGAGLTFLNLLKGKNVTSDQITGFVRTLAVYLAGIAVSHGWLPSGSQGDIISAVVAVVIAGWSWYSNRAKTIVPISQKIG